MSEGREQLLAALTGGATGPGAERVYGAWAGLSVSYDDTLERLVKRKLIAGGRTAQVRESLLATVVAGGAAGESVEECLLTTGLVGFS